MRGVFPWIGALLIALLGCGGSSSPSAPPPPAGPVVTLQGTFHAVAHPGSGVAEILENPDGSHSLRFRDFETENGPSLEVYLVAAADTHDAQSVIDAGYLSLGALQGLTGDQSYDVPDPVDFDVYRSVTVWCVPRGINFITAPLTPVAGS